MDKELTPKQQTSEAIRQAEAVLILTGQRPTVDQVASTIALTAILRKFGKKVTAVISDEVPTGAKFLPTTNVDRTMGGLRDFVMKLSLGNAEVDKLKYDIEDAHLNIHITPFSGGFAPKDVSFSYGEYQFDAIVVLGVASYANIDKVYAQSIDQLRNVPLINIDYHRSNEQYAAINLVDGGAASLGELLISLSESLQGGLIDDTIATAMLTGIMAATDRFTAGYTTAKTMTVAAQMMAMGANQQQIVKGLYRNDRNDRNTKSDRNDKSTAPRNNQPSQQAPQIQKAERTSQPVKPVAPRVEAMAPIEGPTETIAQKLERSGVEIPAPLAQVAPQIAPEQAVIAPEPQVVSFPGAPVQAQPEPRPQPVVEPAPQPVHEVANTPAEPKAANLAMPIPEIATPEPVSVPQPAERDHDDDNLPGGTPALHTPEVASSQAEVTSTGLDDLLPPQHIEPEPLINGVDPVKPKQPRQPKGHNPINNPLFAQRLDEFEL